MVYGTAENCKCCFALPWINELATMSHSLVVTASGCSNCWICIWIAAKTQVLESNSKVLQLNIKIVQCLQRDLAVSNLIYVKQLVMKRKGFSDQVKCHNYWFLFMLYNWKIYHEVLSSLIMSEQSKNVRWAVEYDSSYRWLKIIIILRNKNHPKYEKGCKTTEAVVIWAT